MRSGLGWLSTRGRLLLGALALVGFLGTPAGAAESGIAADAAAMLRQSITAHSPSPARLRLAFRGSARSPDQSFDPERPPRPHPWRVAIAIDETARSLAVASNVSIDGDFAFPTKADTIVGGTGLVVMGYDDDHRIRSSHGALLVRTSFGSAMGRNGVGRLPYRFVEEGLACDFWTLLKPDWLATAELEQPAEISASK